MRCPEREQLADCLLGRLDEAAEDAIFAHLEQCEACQQAAEEMERSGGARVEVVRRAAGMRVEGRVAAAARKDATRSAATAATRSDATSAEEGRGPDGDEAALARARGIAREALAATTGASALSAGRLHAGQRLGGYEILAHLGSGGMGSVYLARHLLLDRRVALKVLDDARLRERRDAVGRFLREIETSGRLEHRHVVHTTDAGSAEADGGDAMHYLVMEYIDGLDAAELVRRWGPLSIADACETARQAALGLAHVHGDGLVHRDMKPSNLMITREGVVKLLDLGLARLRDVERGAKPGAGRGAEALTDSNLIVGTADYLSPEQARSRTVDARADLYALGCTLLKLLAGRAPFEDESTPGAVDKLLAHCEALPPALRQLRSDAPAELEALVAALLAKQPSGRPASAEEVAAALEPFCGGADLAQLVSQCEALAPAEPRLEQKPGGVGAAYRGELRRRNGGWRRRRFVLLVCAAAVAVSAAAGLSAFMLLAGPFSEPPASTTPAEAIAEQWRRIQARDVEGVRQGLIAELRDDVDDELLAIVPAGELPYELQHVDTLSADRREGDEAIEVLTRDAGLVTTLKPVDGGYQAESIWLVRYCDRQDPRAVARAALTALRHDDFESLAELGTALNRRLFGEMRVQGRRHPRGFTGPYLWRWQAVQAWSGWIGPPHEDGELVRVPFLPPQDGDVKVVTLVAEDGRWCFEDVHHLPSASLPELNSPR